MDKVVCWKRRFSSNTKAVETEYMDQSWLLWEDDSQMNDKGSNFSVWSYDVNVIIKSTLKKINCIKPLKLGIC